MHEILKESVLRAVISETKPAATPRKKDFEKVKIIGKGGFSNVYEGTLQFQHIVRHKYTGNLYAMKVIEKASLDTDSKVKQLMNEKQIMASLDHPFIVKLHWSFQSRKRLHFVMDFCAGGELFYHLHNVGRLSEVQAKFYFAEVLLGIEYVHARGIVYRDLKPENILLDIDGHVCLADFGLSKDGMNLNNVTNSFCGSPEYMSPEVLEQKGHTLTVDYYCLGALIYEMIVGLPPHYSTDREEMYRGILHDEAEMPNTFSDPLKDFLQRLLVKSPKHRLGAEQGIRELKEHPWCADIDWSAYRKRKVEPPFKPSLGRSHFDPEYIASISVGQKVERSYSYYCSEESSEVSGIDGGYEGFSFERKLIRKACKGITKRDSVKMLKTERKLQQKENDLNSYDKLCSSSCKRILNTCDNEGSFEKKPKISKGGTVSAKSIDDPSLTAKSSILNLINSKGNWNSTKLNTCSEKSIKQLMHKGRGAEAVQKIYLKGKKKLCHKPSGRCGSANKKVKGKLDSLATMDKIERANYFAIEKELDKKAASKMSFKTACAKSKNSKVKILNRRNKSIEDRPVKSHQELYTRKEETLNKQPKASTKNIRPTLRKLEMISPKVLCKKEPKTSVKTNRRKETGSQMKCEKVKKSPSKLIGFKKMNSKGKVLTSRSSSKKQIEFPNRKSMLSRHTDELDHFPNHKRILSSIESYSNI
eukprot:TRINITY_DN10269_c0_g13_i1.p1 TRINITY_DN10269_c0_g13~~TRINITY_DN10269_c0_g13_i1.p1  ORF type:complete len:701 (-),score=112.04 TRINITY_DN10269_c0_g13_i1:759-2861(-)